MNHCFRRMKSIRQGANGRIHAKGNETFCSFVWTDRPIPEQSNDRHKLSSLVSVEGVHPPTIELRDNLAVQKPAKEFLRFTVHSSVIPFHLTVPMHAG